MGWTDEELLEAKLVHGPDSKHSDTYRLHLESNVEGKPGKMLDVPGWMVGDVRAAALRMRAAAIIRQRILK